MYFDSVYVHNFGPIAGIQLQLAPSGINTIFGYNGSGKTQIVGAIQFALLGETCNVSYHTDEATATPSIVELVLADDKSAETLRCEVDIDSAGTMHWNRMISSPLTRTHSPERATGSSLMLHRKLVRLLDGSNAPTLVVPLELETALDVPQLAFDLFDEALLEDDLLREFVLNLRNLVRGRESSFPAFLSWGQRNLLTLLQEFLRRKNFPHSIPLILDSNLSAFGGAALSIVVRLLRRIAIKDQVLILSSWSDSFSSFEDGEIKTRHDLPQPNFTSRGLSLVSYPYYGDAATVKEEQETRALVVTEGKTDSKHLKAALQAFRSCGMYQTLRVEFHEYGDDTPMGGPELRKLCEQYSRLPNDRKTIFIFDRDDSVVLKHIGGKDKPYKEWGNRVYSFAIPLVDHRPDVSEMCIEFYYTDEEITRQDRHGRRLFLSTEFSERSGWAKDGSPVTYSYPSKLQSSKVSIIDSHVFAGGDTNVALSKNQFADYVLGQVEGFHNFDFGSFRNIFDVIAQITARN